MRNLIKKILRESEDLQWIKDVEMESHLSPSQILHRYDTFPSKVVGPMIEDDGFSDISYEGGKYILKVDSWFDFSDLFLDVHSDYNSIGRDLAKRILSDEDYWEPYDSHDLVYDWSDQVWSMVAGDKELYNYVVKWIGDNLVGDEMHFDRKETTLTKENVLEWSADSDVLGQEIDELDVFEDLKLNLTWAYGSAYNTATRDNIYNSVIGVIRDDFGKGEWESKTFNINGEDKTRHQLRFDVTDLLEDSVTEYISDCWSNCRRWWDPKEQHSGYLEDQSEEEGFEEYCDECRDTPFNEYSTFLYFYKEYLDDTDGLYYPSYDEYPDDEPLTKYFIEDVYARI
jgi:hypothetical protein